MAVFPGAIVAAFVVVTHIAVHAASGQIVSPQAASGHAASGQAGPGSARSSAASGFAALSASADAAREAGRLDEASALYRKALALRPDWQEGWWSLGTILYDRDAYAEAAQAFERLLSRDPRHGTTHLMLALCEYQLDRDGSAMGHLQTARTLGVQKDEQLLRVLSYHEVMLLLRTGRYERAIEAAQPLVTAGVEDEDLDLALGLGVLLIRPKDAPAGGSPGGSPGGSADGSTGGSPDRQTLLRAGRAERHTLAKQFDEAKRTYAALVQEAPSVPNVHYAYGRFLLAVEDLDGAVAEFQEEIKRQPAHVRARMRIAAARYRTDSAAGIPFAREVVTLQPAYPFGHYLLGLLYFDAGDIAGAIPELEAAVRLVPQEPQFHFTLGNAYARAGRKEDAARARAAFLRLNGTDDGATSPPRLDLDGADHRSGEPKPVEPRPSEPKPRAPNPKESGGGGKRQRPR